MSDEINVTVNGVPHVARKGQLVIEAAADAGEYIPRFCYHERMSSVGKCRMCLVECDTGRGPAVTVSCMATVAPDMKIDTQSPTVKRMQEGVLELLLANHPLDCPVCDKGGECPLQDQAFSHGPGESRFVEEKRHFEKPIPISDLVFLDRERCILCDRCTRFADEVAGDPLIHFTSRGNSTHIATFPDEPFASYFSGNTVQICPVGALTAKPYRFKARPWDLQQEESTCTTCSVGCRVVVQSSRDEVLRYMGVDSEPVNHGWLCDRGRFSFEATKSAERVLQPLVREGDALAPAAWNVALAEAARLIGEAKAAAGAGSIAVLGGARGTNEDAFAWARLAHEVIGTTNVYAQMGDGLPVGLLGLDRATIDDAANAATVVLLSPDIKEELPVLYLRLRAAAEQRRTKIIELTPKRTGMTPYAWRHVGYQPGTQVAAVDGLLADADVAAQLATGPVVVVAGRANLAESTATTVQALRRLLDAVPGATVLPAFRRGNVVGALQVGMRPGKGGLDTRGTLQAAADGKIECLVLVGSDRALGERLHELVLGARRNSEVEHRSISELCGREGLPLRALLVELEEYGAVHERRLHRPALSVVVGRVGDHSRYFGHGQAVAPASDQLPVAEGRQPLPESATVRGAVSHVGGERGGGVIEPVLARLLENRCRLRQGHHGEPCRSLPPSCGRARLITAVVFVVRARLSIWLRLRQDQVRCLHRPRPRVLHGARVRDRAHPDHQGQSRSDPPPRLGDERRAL